MLTRSTLLTLATQICLPATVLFAQDAPVDYLQSLVTGSSYLREYCLGPCACALNGSTGPLTGEFRLRYSHRDQWTVFYDVTNIDLFSATDREPSVRFVGSGTYSIGGDFAYTHQLTLNLIAVHEPGNPTHVFDSGVKIVTADSQFPVIVITATADVIACSERTLSIRTSAQAVPGCPVDLGSAGAARGRDGNVDNNDFIVFIGYFFEGDLRADRGSAGGEIGSDGLFDNNDFIAFIDQFFAGCPD